MTPGPVIVIQCPACGALGSYPSINSGNSFGATYYTDGYRDAPMMPTTPPVFRCGACRRGFWTEAANEVGEYDVMNKASAPLDWRQAPLLVEPDEKGYLEAIEPLIAADPSREYVLRMHAWWRGNDRHRGRTRKPVQDDPALVPLREANMMALIQILPSDSAGSKLMHAELLREMGQFDAAIKVLSEPCAPGLELARDRIRRLSEDRNRVVQTLR